MGTPHKHAAIIKAWADGAEIQFSVGSGWLDYKRLPANPSWFAAGVSFRIKPKVIKYRTVLMATLTNFNYVATCNNPDEAVIVEASNGFVKWLGDWVEVEV